MDEEGERERVDWMDSNNDKVVRDHPSIRLSIHQYRDFDSMGV